MAGPLDGYRVLDVTTVLLGPYGAQLLADYGADVVKVEAPPFGDSTRALGPGRSPRMSGTFLNLNRNKRGIALNLKTAGGKAALKRLIETADVFLHNMRPHKIDSLGFGYEQVAAIKPDIVYCGAYGYSQRGPYKSRPAYDDLIQGIGGIAGLFEPVLGEPRFVPTVIADKLVGMTTANAVTMALLHRERTGEGQFVEVPMFETMAAFTLVEHLYGQCFEPPIGGMGYVRVTSAFRKPYPAKDGYICILPYTDAHWREFFGLAGQPELIDDPRFSSHVSRTENTDDLYTFLGEVTPNKTIAEWMALCETAQIPSAPVSRLEDLLNDPHLKEVGLLEEHDHPTEGRTRLVGMPLSFSKSPGAIRTPAPHFGEHNRAVLGEAGFSKIEIDAMYADGSLLEGA